MSEKTVSVGGAPVTVTMCDDGVRVWCGSDGETHDPGTGPVVVVMRNKRLGGWNVNVRPADHTSAGRVKIHVSDSDDLDPVVTLAGVRATYSELYDDEADIWDSDQCAEADDSQSVTP